MNAALRQFASPYARKLARERGIALVDLHGSGPAGRVVAADVLAFTKPVESPLSPPTSPEPSLAPATQPAAVTAALATGIDLGALQKLLEQFAAAQLMLPVDTLLLRATARSLAAIGVNGAIGWETGKGEILIADAGSLPLGALQARLGGDATVAGEAALSVRWLKKSGIRAVSMPPRPGHRLRLVLSGDGGMLDCLLAFDAATVDEDLAVEFLSHFKDDLETPLRLLA